MTCILRYRSESCHRYATSRGTLPSFRSTGVGEPREETAEKIADPVISLNVERVEYTGPIPGLVSPLPA